MSISKTSPASESPALAATGLILPYAASTAPTDWLLCDGSAVSRASYTDLFDTIVPSKGSFTVTIASPAVVTLNSHGFNDGDAVFLTTSGALPTGLSANTLYYVKSPAANTFNLAASRDATTGLAAAAINTSGSQSGTHTLYSCAFGLGDGSTTFNTPDLRGRAMAGLDNIGGSAAGRLSLANASGFGSGAQNVTLTTAEMPSHNHGVTDPSHAHGEHHSTGFSGFTWPMPDGNGVIVSTTGAASTGISLFSAGSGSAHNNMQPYILMSYIIKT